MCGLSGEQVPTVSVRITFCSLYGLSGLGVSKLVQRDKCSSGSLA